MKNIFIALFSFVTLMGYAQRSVDVTDSSVYKIEKLKKIVVNTSFSFKTTGMNLTKLISYRPVPIQSLYQNFIMGEVEKDTDWQLVADSDTTNMYIKQKITDTNKLNRIMDRGLICTDVFIVEPCKVTVDFKKIKKIYPYDTNSVLYKEYTSEQLPDIAPNNEIAIKSADYLWKKSKGNILKYARMCYEEVAKALKYYDDPDMLPFDKIIEKGGGNCGSFASTYITLLRAKGIPARHVIAYLQNRDNHIWAEFYLERYGWIPVDPTWHNGNPKEDYFGRYDGTAIIIGRGLYNPLEYDNGVIHKVKSLQQGDSHYWFTNGTKPEFYHSEGHTSIIFE